MGQRGNKPSFQSVVDLGLRDVGVRNQPRRLAAQFGKGSIQAYLLIVVSAIATCTIVRATGAGRWVLVPFALAWTGALFALALRSARRSPIVVVRVTADGPTRARWLFVVPFVLLLASAVPRGGPLLIPPAVLLVTMVLLLWRGRSRVPGMLRRFRPLLGADETVLGDGIGLAEGLRGWDRAARLVVATDRRLIVTGSAASEPFVLIDAPYERITRFGIEWRYAGRIGVLSVTATGDAPAGLETHAIKAIPPANLVSIARALESDGVPADDPAAVAEAERGWGAAVAEHQRQRKMKLRRPSFDRSAMGTPSFDRGLWLLLALAGTAFYADPTSDPGALLLIVLGSGVASGFVSRTKSSLAYLVPFNLLLAPAFVLIDAVTVIELMVTLGAVAALGLWAGSALRRRNGAARAAAAAARPSRGTLRYTVGGPSLVRLSTIVLVGVLALVVIGSAAGFDATTLRMAYDQATRKQLPVDGRSNLTGGAASFRYTSGPGLHELITDQHFHDGPHDGARWELRSSWTENLNVVSLATYVEKPRLDNAAAIAKFVARKDREHAGLAGFHVSHTTRVVDGRKGYVWNHGSDRGYWFFAAWFPQPLHSIRVECIAKKQVHRFKRLCAEAMRTLRFHGG